MAECFLLEEIQILGGNRPDRGLRFAPFGAAGGKDRIGALDAFEADPPTARHQFVREGNRVEVQMIFDVFQPRETLERGVLKLVHHRLAHSLKGLQRFHEIRVRAGGEASSQRDGVLQCEFRPRADREVGGVQSVAQNDDVAVMPAAIF